jgi:hypothetical protein
MARILKTVDDLVSQVRSLLDEQNVDAISTETDLLPALNRAQDFAVDIYSRFYPEPYIKELSVDLTTAQEYDIPEDAFEDRIIHMEVEVQGTRREVQRIAFHDFSNYESSSSTNVPYYYAVYGRTYGMYKLLKILFYNKVESQK